MVMSITFCKCGVTLEADDATRKILGPDADICPRCFADRERGRLVNETPFSWVLTAILRFHTFAYRLTLWRIRRNRKKVIRSSY